MAEVANSNVLTFLALAAIAVLGAGFAFADWRLIGVPVLGVICVLIIVAGLTAGYFWPYNWADGGLEIQGFIAAVSAGAALAGYVPASLVIWGIRERREVQK